MDWSFPCVHSTTSRRCRAPVLTRNTPPYWASSEIGSCLAWTTFPQDASRTSHWKYITGLNPRRPARVSILTAALPGSLNYYILIDSPL
jgi:hypothetical protein